MVVIGCQGTLLPGESLLADTLLMDTAECGAPPCVANL